MVQINAKINSQLANEGGSPLIRKEMKEHHVIKEEQES